MTTSRKTPVLFVSHGAPTFAIEPGRLGPLLRGVGAQLTGIKAVLVVSPHWQTRDTQVMTTVQPETVHDFGGFPARLYDLQYLAAGAPAQAQEAARLLNAAGFSGRTDARRGLDHGAWVPLMHLFPGADVPVFQVSMPFSLSTQKAVAMGHALAPLREQGVLILASGSMTHNLNEYGQAGGPAAPYAQEFSHWVQSAVLAKAVAAMVCYRTEAPHAARAHPSEEHFLPLLVAMGATTEADAVTVLDGGITHSVLSMESYLWGWQHERAI
jgi:4,5-DOPA dioxygenase extradiol